VFRVTFVDDLERAHKLAGESRRAHDGYCAHTGL
jgi:hypothetical protein